MSAPRRISGRNPRLIPGSMRRPHDRAAVTGREEFATAAPAIVICQSARGKLSQGAAAWLRHAGVAARTALEDGFEGWTKAAKLPVGAAPTKMPPLDELGPHRLGHARARPKVDRIACPWLIRRFIDPRAVFLFVRAGRGRRPSPSASAPRRSTSRACSGATAARPAPSTSMIEEFGLDDPSRCCGSPRSCAAPTPRARPRAASRPGCSPPRSAARACIGDDLAQLEAGDGALRRVLSLVPGRQRRDPQLAQPQGQRPDMNDAAVARDAATRAMRTASRLREAFWTWMRVAALSFRRSGRPDRGDAPHPGRGEALDLREPFPARAQLLHAAAGSRGAAARDLYRLADAPHARRHHGRRAVHRAGHHRHHGAQLRLCRLRQRAAGRRRCSSD